MYPTCRQGGWSKEEDSLLFQAIAETGSTKLGAWLWLQGHGVDRTRKAVNNRYLYLKRKNTPKVKEERKSIPHGWGYYD